MISDRNTRRRIGVFLGSIKQGKREMSIKFTTLLGIAACALVSTNGVAQPVFHSSKTMIVAENGMSESDTRENTIQKQTNPRENGTSQSESRDGYNKNGQPQK
jgi:hypothetical protein